MSSRLIFWDAWKGGSTTSDSSRAGGGESGISFADVAHPPRKSRESTTSPRKVRLYLLCLSIYPPESLYGFVLYSTAVFTEVINTMPKHHFLILQVHLGLDT